MFRLWINIVRWIFGYVYVDFKCNKIERFINALNNSAIYIWCFKEKEEGTYEFFISIKDYRKIKRYIRKTGGSLRIKKKCGLPFYLYRNRDKKLLLLGMITSFSLIVYLSGFIWDIRLEGNYTYTYNEISDVLTGIGVKEGIRKKSFSGEEIEAFLRNKYFDIKWVSVDVKGTVMTINIRENFDRFIVTSNDEPSDIIATRDGVVKSIITRNGVPLVKPGDEVKAGDVLILGTVDVFDDYGEILNKHYVVADGDILLDTLYDYEDSFKRTRLVKEYTGKEKNQYFVGVFKNIFCVWAGKIKYKDYDVIEDTKEMVIGDSLYVPVNLTKKTIREYVLYDLQYTDAEAEELLKNRLADFEEKLIKQGAVNIKKDVVFDIDESYVMATGKIYVTEPAVKFKKIEFTENIEEESQ